MDDNKEAGPSTSADSQKGPNCLFKRMKRGGGNAGASNRRRPLEKSSSSSSDNSDENSDPEVYKKPKKSKTGLVQSTTAVFNVNKSKKKDMKMTTINFWKEILILILNKIKNNQTMKTYRA